MDAAGAPLERATRTRPTRSFLLLGPRGARAVGIEVKASGRWRPEFSRALQELQASRTIQRAVGVYLGDRPLQDGAVRVLPFGEFIRALGRGKVIPGGRSQRLLDKAS